MILQPVYNPFAEVVKNTGRRLVVSELKNANEVYSLDLADMERKIDEENVKLLIFAVRTILSEESGAQKNSKKCSNFAETSRSA